MQILTQHLAHTRSVFPICNRPVRIACTRLYRHTIGKYKKSTSREKHGTRSCGGEEVARAVGIRDRGKCSEVFGFFFPFFSTFFVRIILRERRRHLERIKLTHCNMAGDRGKSSSATGSDTTTTTTGNGRPRSTTSFPRRRRPGSPQQSRTHKI